MRKNTVMDIFDILFIPLITYLVIGLLLIQLCELPVDITRYAMWGVMAGIVLGLQKYFSNKAVTVGIAVYGLAIVLWFCLGEKEGMQHALLFCISFVSILALRFLMQIRLVKIIIGYAIMGIMIYCCIVNVEFSKIFIGFSIILFLNAVSETIAIFSSGNVKSLIVIYVMVAAFTILMPVSDEPYGWDFVFNIIESVERVVDKIVTEINYRLMDAGVEGIFRFGVTGYSDSQMNLSAGLIEQDVEQLELQGNRTKRNLYLKGNVSNEYKGNTWITDFDSETLDYRVDTLMTLYAFCDKTSDTALLRKFMEIKEQKVILQNIKTKSLFYPIKLLDISVEDVVGEGDSLRALRINERGYTYSYLFVDIDYTNEQVVDILKNSRDIVYEEDVYNRIYTNLNDVYGVEIEPIPFDEFCRMAEKSKHIVQKQYMGVGEQVSENVKELADELTKDSEETYDICKILEKYLYGYNYNKAVVVPENVNILDWFLFEEKEGYCAHYATALAVMLRLKGIPSRVAEGFLVDYKDNQGNYSYSISSNTAHVWVEAYIEGFGWIRLEPTVVNAGNANAAWYSEADAETQPFEEKMEEDFLNEQELKEQQTISWVMMLKLLGGMLILISTIISGLLIYRKVSVKKSNNPDVVFGYMISVFEKKFFAKMHSETLGEYLKRLQNEGEIPENLQKELDEIRLIMEMYWYGNGIVSAECIIRMKKISTIWKRAKD